MSGGSYDYLCFKEADDWLAGPPERAQDMADRLAALGHHDAAAAVNDCIVVARIARARMESLLKRVQPVMKAIEWHESGDWGQDKVDAALAEFRS